MVAKRNIQQTTAPTNQTDGKSVESSSEGLHGAIISAVKLERQIEKGSGKVSLELLKTGRVYQDRKTIGKVWNETGVEPASAFLSALKVEEDFIKSREARGYQVDKLPRFWVNPKSVIKAALNYGLDLKKFKSESELRKKVTEIRKSLKGEDKLGDAIKAFKKAAESMPERIAIAALEAAKWEMEAALKDESKEYQDRLVADREKQFEKTPEQRAQELAGGEPVIAGPKQNQA